MLRRKSLDFVRTGLWQKLTGSRTEGQSLTRALASFSREERIFSIFGLLSAAWTGYAILAAASVWQSRVLSSIRNLWAQSGDQGRMLASLGILIISVPFVVAIMLQVAKWIQRAFRTVPRH